MWLLWSKFYHFSFFVCASCKFSYQHSHWRLLFFLLTNSQRSSLSYIMSILWMNEDEWLTTDEFMCECEWWWWIFLKLLIGHEIFTLIKICAVLYHLGKYVSKRLMFHFIRFILLRPLRLFKPYSKHFKLRHCLYECKQFCW